MSSMTNLPNEILSDILGELAATSTHKSDLFSVCLVNKRLNYVGSPLLYYHIVTSPQYIVGENGVPEPNFPEKFVRAFSRANHQSVSHIRHLTILKPPVGKSNDVHADLSLAASRFLVKFIQCLRNQNLSSVDIDYPNFSFLLASLPGLRSFGVMFSPLNFVLASTYGPLAAIMPGVYHLQASMFQNLVHLKLQVFEMTDLKEIWEKTGKGNSILKHLSIFFIGSYSVTLSSNDGDLVDTLENSNFLVAGASQKLSLSSLNIRFCQPSDIRLLAPRGFEDFLAVNLLESISLNNCWHAGPLLRAVASDLESLKSLKLFGACDMWSFSVVLSSLPNPLEILAFDGWCDERGGLVERESMLPHRRTLKKFFFQPRRFRQGPVELRALYRSGSNALKSGNRPFTIDDLLEFTNIEELAIALYPCDAHQLTKVSHKIYIANIGSAVSKLTYNNSKLPNLRVLSILNHYRDSILDWNLIPTPCGSIWEVVKKWVSMIELIELKRGSRSLFHIPEASNLKVIGLQANSGWMRCLGRHFLTKSEFNENGDWVTTTNAVSAERIHFEYPEITIFNMEDGNRNAFFW
ncbi:hypothetical protein TWF694_004679 [Orbilia ellipsospora]|uniref:F-box domain-containing protein n=1 Tax=Orbilia ellipsospora TaxID=2528407 RepID=A0AAV9WVW4_9PEZI